MTLTEDGWDDKIRIGREQIDLFYDYAFDNNPQKDGLCTISKDLWEAVMHNPPRTPLAVAMDCCYIVCSMTGNRVSIKKMRDISEFLFDKPIRVLATPKRSKRKWPLEPRYKGIVLSALFGDEEAFNDMASEW